MFCYTSYSGIIYINTLKEINFIFLVNYKRFNIFIIYNLEDFYVHRRRGKAPKVWKLNMGQAGMFLWKFLMELLL